jgi:hypothetical protein
MALRNGGDGLHLRGRLRVRLDYSEHIAFGLPFGKGIAPYLLCNQVMTQGRLSITPAPDASAVAAKTRGCRAACGGAGDQVRRGAMP